MTTKTRADLLAAKEEIERQLSAMKMKQGDAAYAPVLFRDYVHTNAPSYTFISGEAEYNFTDYGNTVVPAADLIPRAEHDLKIAALEENIRCLTRDNFDLNEQIPDFWKKDESKADLIPRAEHERLLAEARKTVMADISPELDELLNRPMPDHDMVFRTPADELKKGDITAVFGKWPGDETDEEITETLALMAAPITVPDAEPVTDNPNTADELFRAGLEKSIGWIGVNTTHGIYKGKAYNHNYHLHVWKGDKEPNESREEPVDKPIRKKPVAYSVFVDGEAQHITLKESSAIYWAGQKLERKIVPLYDHPSKEAMREFAQWLREDDETDAEPEIYANFYPDGTIHAHISEKNARKHAALEVFETAVPLYRHPAPPTLAEPVAEPDKWAKDQVECWIADAGDDIKPDMIPHLAAAFIAYAKTPAQPVAVASQSVVDEILEKASDCSIAYNAYANSGTVICAKELWFKNDAFHAALAKITVLPEPDKFWSGQMSQLPGYDCVFINAPGNDIGVGISDIPGFCAALMQKGKEGAK